MELEGTAALMRVFIGESDKLRGRPLYERIVEAARKEGLAGATALKGVMAYGANSVIHTAKLLDLSGDLPVVVEIVDREEAVEAFKSVLDALFDEAGGGGLVTVEKVTVHRYVAGRRAV